MNSKSWRVRAFVKFVVVPLGILALVGCATPGKIAEISQFDATTASPDDIAKALKEDGRVAISGGILFETDKAAISSSAADLVRRISDMMKNNPDIKVAVVGHTDSSGQFKYNLQLSQRRAMAIVQALIKTGIETNRLAAVGVGPLSPVGTNDTTEGRAQNRRVELVLIR